MARLVGQSLGRYEIVALIGKGGMGDVYRARDTELGRDVAVKVLPAEIADEKNRLERFKREARAVAQLSHPNILDIHDFGAEGGISYSVTELLEGCDLRQRLTGHPLPMSKVLKIGQAVAEGLAAAHSKGIVHRDIKPANIFLTTSGQIKILDFGIAGLRAEVSGDQVDTDSPTRTLTAIGQIIGTTSYMSPEQVAGKTADARSDIFSLGCVLYEMLTGRRAFDGDNANDTMVAIVSRDPVPIAELRSDVPAAIDLLVQRCLEKEPGERFESARDVAFSLESLNDERVPSRPVPAFSPRRSRRSIRAGLVGAAVVVAALLAWQLVGKFLPLTPALPAHKRIALAPFDVAGGGSSNRAFAVGLTRSLEEDLALVAQQEGGIEWVVPCDQAAATGEPTVARLGRTFGVDLVVTGLLDRDDDRVNLELALVAPESGRTMRSAVIEDSLSNIDAFQFGPVNLVADLLGVTVTPETRERIESGATTMTRAFDAFTRGRGALVLAGQADEVEAAADLIDAAVAEDPLFARGWVLRGRSRLARFEHTDDPEWIERGLGDAARALELGGKPEEAWQVSALLHRAAGDTAEAIRDLEAGLQASPDDAELRLDLAAALEDAGRVAEAESEIRHAIYLRPDYWVGYDRLAKLQLAEGNLEAAAVEFQHVIDSAPEFALGYVKLAGVYMYLERPEPARALLERSIEIERTPWALTNLGTLHYDAARYAQAADYFSAALVLQPDDWVLWGNLGYAYRFGARPDAANDAFLRAVDAAEAERAKHPGNLELAVAIAGYRAMLGQVDQGLSVLDEVVAAGPTGPILLSLIAEAYEDLGDRERALEWVGRAFAAGVEPSRFEGRPTLGKLIADERYAALVDRYAGA